MIIICGNPFDECLQVSKAFLIANNSWSYTWYFYDFTRSCITKTGSSKNFSFAVSMLFDTLHPIGMEPFSLLGSWVEPWFQHNFLWISCKNLQILKMTERTCLTVFSSGHLLIPASFTGSIMIFPFLMIIPSNSSSLVTNLHFSSFRNRSFSFSHFKTCFVHSLISSSL